MEALFELIKVLCLGILEGITEWLPISSTGNVEHWNSVSQSAPILKGDVDNSGKVDPDDAIYLLYHVNFPSSYPLHENRKNRKRCAFAVLFCSINIDFSDQSLP